MYIKRANEGVEYFELKFNKKALGYYGVTEEDINRFLNSMVSGVSGWSNFKRVMRRIAPSYHNREIPTNTKTHLRSSIGRTYTIL